MTGDLKNAAYKSRLDRISATFSFLCLVHCIVLPVFVTTLPLFGVELVENIYVDAGTVLTAFFVGGLAVWRGYKRHHHRLLIVWLFISGIVLMLTASFIKSEWIEIILKLVGAGLVISAHVLNWRSCRNCEACHQ